MADQQGVLPNVWRDPAKVRPDLKIQTFDRKGKKVSLDGFSRVIITVGGKKITIEGNGKVKENGK